MQNLKRFLTFTALLLAFAAVSLAQTGSIQGVVLDKSGAVVAAAQVSARSLATNQTSTATTSGSGYFSLTNLPVGDYEVKVAKESFKTFIVKSVELTVAQVLTVNAELEPGSVSEEVQVRADELPPVELESSQISNLVDQRKMADLPLLTRDPYSLILLSPGTTQSNSSLGGFSVNGSRERNNNFLLDGSDNNDTSVPGIPGGLASLNPDATEEFRVITNNFNAEYGRNSGAIIDVVTKSGTNNFHGTAYWFGRYNALGARDFFNPAIDENGDHQKQNPYVRNQFGFSFGGPIIKNKTFFFVNNEWQRFRTTLTESALVPTDAFKTGIFTWTDRTGVAHPIDISTPASPDNANGLPISPFMQQILGLYPSPDSPSADGITALKHFASSSRQDVSNTNAKLDHHFSDREGLSIHGSYDTFKDPNPFHDEFLPNLGAVGTSQHVLLLGATLTSTIRPTIVNEAKFGFNRTDDPFTCGNLSALNIGATDSFGRARDFTLPTIAGFGCQELGDSNGQTRRTGTWSWGDAMSIVKGKHTIKFGAEFRRVFENGFNSFGSRDTVTFNGFSNFGVPFVNVSGSGQTTLQNMADMLFGIMDTETQNQFFNKAGVQTADDNRLFRQHEYGYYFQDSWKVLPNFTLNLGLRYQFNGVPYEVNNNLSNLLVAPSGPAPFTFQIVGPGTGHLLYNNDYKDIEPRIGFAWDPRKDGKTSIRGAFGIFHDRVFGNLFGNARGNPPFQEAPFNIPFDTPDNVPLPAVLPADPTVQDGAGIFPTLFPQHFPQPYSSNWNFGVQRELLHDLTLEVNYVGTRGFHELRVLDGNAPDPAVVTANIAAGTDPNVEQFANLWFGGPGVQATGNSAFFQAGLNEAIGNSWYNGLQMNVTKRFSHGLQIQGAYTYSHSIDDSSDPLVAAEGNRSFPRNSHALQNERGNSDFDIRQRLVINYVYEFPFGRGRAYANHGAIGRILEGWQISGITSFQSGHPFDVFGNVDAEHTGLSSRLNVIGDTAIPAGHPRNQTGPSASAFDFPDPVLGLPGNVGRNHFTGPGYNNWDAVMTKETSLGERFKLETRFEFYNVFNRVQFDQPGNLLQSPSTFGLSTLTLNRVDGTTSARQIQFGMKLKF